MSEDLIDLACTCGNTARLPNGRPAYDAGWRLDKKNRQMCPTCSAKRERRSDHEGRKKYGSAAWDRAGRDVDRLFGESKP